VSHSKVGQQLLGVTLRVNPWLWNWALVCREYTSYTVLQTQCYTYIIHM